MTKNLPVKDRDHPMLAQFVAATTMGNTTLLTVQSDIHSDTHAGQALVEQLRTASAQAHAGFLVLVGGSLAAGLDFDRSLYTNFLRTLLFILGATYVLLLFMFRSLLLPLKAIVMNVLSISAAYGALVFVFQQGHFAQLLGFISDGSIDRFIPILLFCVLFGLSMDYEVFLLSRIREEWVRTHNNRFAVARGLEQTGGVITNAALLFVIVSGAFTFTSLIVTKELGLGITVAVLVDATIIRAVLVPATMQLLGRWNWWLPTRSLLLAGSKPHALAGTTTAAHEVTSLSSDAQGGVWHQDTSEHDLQRAGLGTVAAPDGAGSDSAQNQVLPRRLLDGSSLPTLPLSLASPYQHLFSLQRAERIWLALVDHPEQPLERSLAFHIAQALAKRSHKRVLLLELCGREHATSPRFATYAEQIRPSLLACTHMPSLLARHHAPTITSDGQHFPALALLTGLAEALEGDEHGGWNRATSDLVAATIGELAALYDYLLLVTTQTTPTPLMHLAAEECQRSVLLVSAPRGDRDRGKLTDFFSLPQFAGSSAAERSLFVTHVPERPTMGMQDRYASYLEGGGARTSPAEAQLIRLLPADDPLLERCWQRQAALGQIGPEAALTQAIDFVARHLARQTVGIAFGGGGARGFAHIGIMKRLREHGVPLDYLAGCSSGVITPTLSLLGKSFTQIEEIFLQIHQHLVRWRFPRTSIFSNKGLKQMLDELSGTLCFEDLPLPLAMVAVDLVTGREVVLDRGPLGQAVLASVAIPGIFPPVVIGNHVLVDALLCDPVPTSIVRKMGADIVIAANLRVQEPPACESTISCLAQAAGDQRQHATVRAPHLVEVLLRSYELALATIGLHSVREADVVIHPKLHRVSLRQFSQANKFVTAGEEAVEEALPALEQRLPWLGLRH